MPKIEILNRYTSAVIASGEYENLKEAVVKHSAYLEGANLEGANLEDANLEDAYLRDAYLRGAYLRGANLRGANLRGANLEDANLGGANLEDANLEDAYLRGAYLEGAYLRGANLRGANLRGANLRGAHLRGAHLRGANLEDAKGINPYLCTPLLMLLDQPDNSILRAYKLVNEKSEGPIKGGITYKIGKVAKVLDANVDTNEQCGAGINVATLDWCVREWREGYRILIVEFQRKDIACIPTATDGKFRLFSCTPVGEKDLVEIGLIKTEEVDKT